MPLTPREIEAIYYETYRAGAWDQIDKPIVQRELQDTCWQSVLDAVRKESADEIERLTQEVKDYQTVVISAVESQV